jgi:apolipoprotein N-acyltransferase
METAYDWITVLIFAGLVTLFLSRSVGESRHGDSIWHYLGASVGCAVANWLGNEGHDLIALAVIGGTLLYIYYHLFRGAPPAD